MRHFTCRKTSTSTPDYLQLQLAGLIRAAACNIDVQCISRVRSAQTHWCLTQSGAARPCSSSRALPDVPSPAGPFNRQTSGTVRRCTGRCRCRSCWACQPAPALWSRCCRCRPSRRCGRTISTSRPPWPALRACTPRREPVWLSAPVCLSTLTCFDSQIMRLSVCTTQAACVLLR